MGAMTEQVDDDGVGGGVMTEQGDNNVAGARWCVRAVV